MNCLFCLIVVVFCLFVCVCSCSVCSVFVCCVWVDCFVLFSFCLGGTSMCVSSGWLLLVFLLICFGSTTCAVFVCF